MKLFRLAAIASLACFSWLPFGLSVSAQPKAAHPQSPITDCSSAVSMIVAPDGTCYNLSYLTTLGNARSNLGAAQNLQDQVLNLNESTGKATTYTYDVGRGKSISNTYSNNPSEDEKKAREKLLEASSQNLNEQSKQTQDVESSAFLLQTYVLSQLSGSLAGRTLNGPLVGSAR